MKLAMHLHIITNPREVQQAFLLFPPTPNALLTTLLVKKTATNIYSALIATDVATTSQIKEMTLNHFLIYGYILPLHCMLPGTVSVDGMDANVGWL